MKKPFYFSLSDTLSEQEIFKIYEILTSLNYTWCGSSLISNKENFINSMFRNGLDIYPINKEVLFRFAPKFDCNIKMIFEGKI
jgi:hypothetical protein